MFKEKFVKMISHLPPGGGGGGHPPPTPGTPPPGGGSSWLDQLKSLGTQGANVAQAAGAGVAGSTETNAFLDGMRALAAESNYIQLEMAKLELSKKLAEGFAKFLKEMGKAFTQIGQ